MAIDEEVGFNPLSQSSYFLRSRDNDNDLSCATGFFVRRNGGLFLITNWHVVSGRNSETNECLSSTCAIPNNLLVRIHKQSQVIEFDELVVPLHDANGDPLWLEHPLHGGNVDVVAIQIDLPAHLIALDVEDFIEPFNDDTREVVADDVFILGYPFGISAGGIFPIWKRASIASEPSLNLSGLPKMLVDTASRSGMSGSPVVLLSRRPITLMGPSPTDPNARVMSRHRMKIVGVYSGRIGAKDRTMEAQLGIVWKMDVVDEIINRQ